MSVYSTYRGFLEGVLFTIRENIGMSGVYREPGM